MIQIVGYQAENPRNSLYYNKCITGDTRTIFITPQMICKTTQRAPL